MDLDAPGLDLRQIEDRVDEREQVLAARQDLLEVFVLTRLEARLRQEAAKVGEATRTTFTIKTAVSSAPAMSDPRMMEWIDQSASSLGHSFQRMPSGAGHDAQEVARIAPMAMIFVPSVGGISHSPREFTKPEDIVNGIDVLLNAVVRADRAWLSIMVEKP